MKKGFIIAIDGPLASGKGTIAKKLARVLHGVDLYTGAMYRSVALFCINSGVNLENATDVIVQLDKIIVRFTQGRILLNDTDVTDAIQESAIAEGASVVAVIPQVREELVRRQKKIGHEEMKQGNVVVVEGRDIGTVVFPDAAFKIYLTASLEARAKRRFEQFKRRNSTVTLDEVLQQITARDSRDTTRTQDPLPSEPEKLGYFILDNSEMNEDRTIDAILTELKKGNYMIDYKTPEQIKLMQHGGHILATVLGEVMDAAVPGVTELELDQLAEKRIRALGGEPGFMKVHGYHHTTCFSTNDVVVHGIPSDYVLQSGDVVGIDCGVYYKGLHTDMSETKIVQNSKFKVQSEVEKFLKIGKIALEEAIKQAIIDNRIGHISQTIQRIVEKEAGYSVVRSLIGHGVGKELHEAPEVPGYLVGSINRTPLLKEGMTIAVEVIYNMGTHDVVLDPDHWTIRTRDGKLSGLYERTIAITKNGPLMLTK